MEMSHATGDGRPRNERFSAISVFASILCLIPALYCLGIVAFALANFDRYASATPQQVRYVIVPGLLFMAFAGVAVLCSRVTRAQVGGIGVAVLLGLFAFETKLQLASFAAIRGLVATPPADWMVARGLTRGLAPSKTARKLNRRLGVTDLPDAVIGGIPGERVLLCGKRGRPVIYTADRYGFRNADAIYDRPINTVLIGDSFVEGICLPDGKDLVGRLRANQSGTVGLGTRGAGPLLELAILGRFGPHIRPRHVVMVFYEGNDWENLSSELREPWLRAALSDTAVFGPAVLPQATIDRTRPILADWTTARQARAIDILKRTHMTRNFLALHQTWSQLGLAYPEVAPDKPEYAQILARAEDIADDWGGKTILVYLPQTGRLRGVLPGQFVFDQVRERVLSAARDSGVTVIDLTPIFLAQERPTALYAEDGHLSRLGADLAADAIEQGIVAVEASAD